MSEGAEKSGHCRTGARSHLPIVIVKACETTYLVGPAPKIASIFMCFIPGRIGVPVNDAVPFPLLVKVRCLGSRPLSRIEGTEFPMVVTVKEKGECAVPETVDGLVMA
jgi:hypothetical protein